MCVKNPSVKNIGPLKNMMEDFTYFQKLKI